MWRVMSGRTGSESGCWTCRLRRKGCDGALPECENCKGLEITCHRSPTKPEWMDSGTQEKEMAEAIKHQIKENAIGRRERQAQNQGASTSNSTPFIVTSQDTFISGNGNTPAPGTHATGSSEHPIYQPAASERVRIATSILNTASNCSSSNGGIEAPKTMAEAWELDFIMIYLDHVFPFLFPFYQLPLVGTSRAWLLSFVKQNDSVFHSVISISSFFFTIGHKEIFQDQLQLCRSTLWGQVSTQSKMAFETLQTDIERLKSMENPPSVIQKAQMMETIVQLLIFDQFIGGSDRWNKPLETALELFEDIYLESHLLDPTASGLDCVLNRMKLPGPQVVGKALWNGHQSAFRFFTALLIHLDIIASTALERAPRLHHLHPELLGELPIHEIGTPLNLAHFVGCYNWVLRTIGDISALASWKKEMIRTEALSHLELLERSKPILETLKRGLENLNKPRETNGVDPYYHCFEKQFRSPFQIPSAGFEETANRIWIYAARIYLSVVLFGWKPSDREIMADARKASELLESVDSLAQIRSLCWPICVIGCITEDNREVFDILAILRKAEDSQLLYSVREAGWIITEISVLGAEPDTLDLAYCLQVFGYPYLLV